MKVLAGVAAIGSMSGNNDDDEAKFSLNADGVHIFLASGDVGMVQSNGVARYRRYNGHNGSTNG